jgi:hypothetical protein
MQTFAADDSAAADSLPLATTDALPNGERCDGRPPARAHPAPMPAAMRIAAALTLKPRMTRLPTSDSPTPPQIESTSTVDAAPLVGRLRRR